MKKFIYIINCFIASTLLYACYDDNGNYNYEDIGNIKFTLPIDTTIMYKNKLEITPRNISFENCNEDEFAWKWELAKNTGTQVPEYKELGNEKTLVIESLNEEIGKYVLRLSAIHKKTNVRTMNYCQLIIDNGLSRGFLALTKQSNGYYDIDAVTFPAGEIHLNQYFLKNEQYIENAKKLVYVNSGATRDERLYLFQEIGGQTLSPIDLSYQGEAESWFYEAPENIKMQGLYYDAQAKDQFFVTNGMVYHLDNWTQPLKASLPDTPVDGYENYQITGVGTIHNSSNLGRYAFYDGINGCFYEWNFGYGMNFLQKLKAETNEINNAFDPEHINKEFVTAITGKEDRLWIIFKDSNQDYWLYTFYDKAKVYYNVTITPYEKPVKLEGEVLELFKRATAFEAIKTVNKFYFAVDNNIYIYNADTHKIENTPFYTSEDTSIKFSKILYWDKYRQEIAISGNSHGKGIFYRILVDHQGRIMEENEELTNNDIFKTYSLSGEIIDFIYKYKSY